ncbi:hypothetical protein [Brevibacillus sp. NL20B1]|jgi:hypothetical protein|uniref:hypothetical protein n=1 Tax=Brevibacillus sp. NL20B1 TaxID=2829799 RepID=UPI001B936760|nr:hypothetical protein [Brevibacillus sp. NL20B1]MBR8660682.1 hypothetical protein [Brevibacillus sp. NL20B1]
MANDMSLEFVVRYAVPQFKSDAIQIFELIEFMKSKEVALNIIAKLPLNIPNPFEDSIRYRYVIAVEFFKKVSKCIKKAYSFKDYEEMKQKILPKELQDAIKPSLDLRNTFAHIFVSDVLDFIDLEISEIVTNLNALTKILEIYVAYVKSRS